MSSLPDDNLLAHKKEVRLIVENFRQIYDGL